MVDNTGPLKGLKILDMSRILAGPYATQLLGDMGADVIKVERPVVGDDTRAWGPPYVTTAEGNVTRESAYYMCTNRNKRSIAVDMADPQGAETLRRLAAKADVVIQNFKVDGLLKYGLDYEALKERNPALVYCSISGFGQTGPNRDKPGYDLLAQGYGGMMSLTGEPDGAPVKVGVGIADIMCGMYASNAILAALRHRDATGEGQHIDIALVDTQIAWLANEGVNYLASGQAPKRRGNQHPNIVPYQVFECADGHVIVAAGNDGQFARFATLIGMPELAGDDRFILNTARLENREVLIALLSERLKQMEKAALVAAMEANNVPGGEINTVPEVFETDQVAAREMKISIPHPLAAKGHVDLIGNPVKFSATPVSYRQYPPICGEHTDEVLSEWLKEE
ncbi:CaiB/BaiF CoA transferase family protein [Profundibacter amoris]|uniref:CoA transferase n=1 Tax=Profundibacter amoris TaxID=2171755 RepID=A0A347UEC1_9RHOB|nr:CaiB/BaiF CoA-transferase family protein [Profundibacter amoris]AXX97199.1 CoA transferase [Profundibacter amoris]